MSSAGGSLARTSALPARAPGSPASDPGSGSSSPELLARYDPASRSWKTSQRSLLEGWAPFSGTWPRSGMTRSGTAFRLPPLARLTDGIESGSSPIPTPTAGDSRGSGSRNTASSRAHPGVSLTDYVRGDGGTGRTWPTPDASVANLGERPDTWLARRERVKAKGINGNGMGVPLAIAVQMWPTPTAQDAQQAGGLGSIARGARGLSLHQATRQWPTPAARDHRHPNSRPYSERGGGTKGEQLPNAVGGALNPPWVEWLMGYPIEYTDCGPSEMRSSRRSRKSSGGRS